MTLGERSAQVGVDLYEAEEIIRSCEKCGGTGLLKSSIKSRYNLLSQQFSGDEKDIDKLEEAAEQREYRKALAHSKKKKENPENSSYGLCKCRIKFERIKVLLYGNYPADMATAKPSDVINREIQIINQARVDARDFVQMYVRKFPAAKRTGVGCNFLGGYGRGKTYLAQLIGSRIARMRYSVYYTPLFLLLEGMGNYGVKNESLLYHLSTDDYLVIDDIGNEQEHRRKACSELAYFLQQRIASKKVTFFVFNTITDIDSIADMYGSLFYNVCNERNMTIKFKTIMTSNKTRKAHIDKLLKTVSPQE